jgi:hypothetical protein
MNYTQDPVFAAVQVIITSHVEVVFVESFLFEVIQELLGSATSRGPEFYAP